MNSFGGTWLDCWKFLLAPGEFDYRRGGIYVKLPNEETIEKTKQIAEEIGAELWGDEGEEY